MDEEMILSDINSPEDLKKVPAEKLPELCKEIREFLVDNISKTGGHLSSNLGVVEITVGIHRVFSSPDDHIMFDVGHQAYTHKILTGRKDRFDTLRQKNGLSGFLNPNESPYDCFVSGHASNSISVALGLARADKLCGKKAYSVCVIGDGALTGGMAYEALNDAGRSGLPIVVVLNDNEMSISKNVGGMAKWFSKLRIKPGYISLKSDTRSFLLHFGKAGEWLIKKISDFKGRVKTRVLPENMFSVLGFSYLGPADGNSIEQVVSLLSEAKRLKKPVVIHFKTQKGKGYQYSESEPSAFHGVSSFDKNSGRINGNGKESFSSVLGETLVKLAQKDTKICAITAAMDVGTGLSQFKKIYPTRFFDVGIAEEHAVAMSAAMASKGMLPVCAVYSTFLQRAYDQLLHDTALNNYHVVLAIDRSGPVGADGPTHHGLFDTSFLRSVPGMAIFAPSSYAELSAAVKKALYEIDGPVAVKYPKGVEKSFKDNTFDYDAVRLKEGKDVTLITYGIMINTVSDIAEALLGSGISAEVIKMNRIDKTDDALIVESVMKTGVAVVCEDCIRSGSAGEAIAAMVSEKKINCRVRLFNFGSSFAEVASVDEIYEEHGLNVSKIVKEIKGELCK